MSKTLHERLPWPELADTPNRRQAALWEGNLSLSSAWLCNGPCAIPTSAVIDAALAKRLETQRHNWRDKRPGSAVERQWAKFLASYKPAVWLGISNVGNALLRKKGHRKSSHFNPQYLRLLWQLTRFNAAALSTVPFEPDGDILILLRGDQPVAILCPLRKP